MLPLKKAVRFQCNTVIFPYFWDVKKTTQHKLDYYDFR